MKFLLATMQKFRHYNFEETLDKCNEVSSVELAMQFHLENLSLPFGARCVREKSRNR